MEDAKEYNLKVTVIVNFFYNIIIYFSWFEKLCIYII